jgi:hypothetical protein
MIHILFIISFIVWLFPSVMAVPKVPHYNLLFLGTILANFFYKPNEILYKIDYVFVILFTTHGIFWLFGWYSLDYNKTLTELALPYFIVRVLWGCYEFQSRNQVVILKLFLIGIFITAITTIIGLFYFPDASRALAGLLSVQKDINTIRFYLFLGIGSYDFAVINSFLCMIFSYWLLNPGKSPIPRFVLLICLPILFFAVIVQGFTGALIICLFGMVAVHLNFLWSSSIYIRIFVLFVFVGLFQLQSLFAPVFYGLANQFSENENIGVRFENIALKLDGVLQSNEFVESDEFLDTKDIFLGGYEIRARRSWNSFLSNPLKGGGDAGGHHFFLDYLGRYGLLGALSVFLVFYSSYKNASNKILSRNNKGLYSILFLIFLVLGLIKTYMLLQFFILIFFVIPLMLNYTQKKIF